ncbi:hypothetical protein [Mycolicibacterium komossense]|uniref:PASTA domain-containing protein n=1 Tax=Mycolicibacterium komossense TaxID=1779 RepID=A0ABT3C548_9MYCO|nr:hypothetical protein [Mycolicibacterium komossense]MCV7224600.1 hypothetical protein [Mycolicibacterium komossense]
MRTAMTITAAAVAAFGVLAAPAGLASADGKTAQQTISDLQSQGYTVTIDKIGSGPMSACVVTSVRNPQQVTQWVPAVGPVLGNSNRNVLVQQVQSQTISVSLNCS